MDEDGAPAQFNLTLHATDSDNDTITWSLDTNPYNGTASVNGTGTSQTIHYTPMSGYHGYDSFVVKISDDLGETETLLVDVTIDPRNDPPVNTLLPTISGSFHVGSILSIDDGFWNDDTDQNPGNINFSYLWQRADDDSGTNAISIGSNYEYQLLVADNLKYIRAQVTATDDGEGLPSSQSVTVTTHWELISNTAPWFSESSPRNVVMDEDNSPTAFELILHATDDENDPFTCIILSTASHGAATVTDFGTFQEIAYQPIADYNGNDTFSIQITDSIGASSSLTVNVTINPRNDPPNNTVPPGVSGIYHVGNMLTIDPGTWNDNTDQEPSPISLTYQWQVSDDEYGTVVNTIGSSQTYTLSQSENLKYVRAQITATDHGEGLPIIMLAVKIHSIKSI